MICFAQYLPDRLKKILFGDRRKFGLVPDENDACWKEWQSRYLDFYYSTQKTGSGDRVNNAGYEILQKQKLDGKIVCEIGPGGVSHLPYWQGVPREYIAVDVSPDFLAIARDKVAAAIGCPFRGVITERKNIRLPLEDESVDILLSFYSLEHLNLLDEYLREYKRILKPGGLLIGAIPNEGGLGWGLGRVLTSRRWIQKNTTINYDKIICWEHPNFIDFIMKRLDAHFICISCAMFPFVFLPIADLNLVTKFIYQKR